MTGDSNGDDIQDWNVFGGASNPAVFIDSSGVLNFQNTVAVDTTSIGPASIILSANSTNFITTMTGDHIEIQDGSGCHLHYLREYRIRRHKRRERDSLVQSNGIMAVGNTTGVANRTLAVGGLLHTPITLTGSTDAIDPHTAATYVVNTVGVNAMTIAASDHRHG